MPSKTRDLWRNRWLLETKRYTLTSEQGLCNFPESVRSHHQRQRRKTGEEIALYVRTFSAGRVRETRTRLEHTHGRQQYTYGQGMRKMEVKMKPAVTETSFFPTNAGTSFEALERIGEQAAVAKRRRIIKMQQRM